MEVSKLGLIEKKDLNLDKQYPIQDMLIKTGQIEQFGSGVYAYGHIPLLLSKRINDVIRRNLNRINCIEVSLPLLQPERIWVESGRLARYTEDDVIFRFMSEKGNYCLAPTAEEAMVVYARNRIRSHKNLPITFYQIGQKFRNEIRTRGYLLRGKAFEMMDAYSFGRNMEDLMIEYEAIKDAYYSIFRELGIEILAVNADNGTIGGKKSEEFMCISDIGEDTILYDTQSGRVFNKELIDNPEYLKRFEIDSLNNLESKKAIELGHVFQLGDRYSRSMNGFFIDNNSQKKNYIMGCYGIGTSRTLAYIYENSIIKDKNNRFGGISLPLNLAPYSLYIIPKIDDTDKMIKCLSLYKQLLENGVNVLFDDRSGISVGSKIMDCKITGTPYFVIMGKSLDEGIIEIENCKTGEKIVINIEDFVSFMIHFENRDDKSIGIEEFYQRGKQKIR